jgi:hypothetical protein
VDIDAPEELYKLFGPEVYGSCAVEAQPVTPIETAGQIFQQWAEEGRSARTTPNKALSNRRLAKAPGPYSCLIHPSA